MPRNNRQVVFYFTLSFLSVLGSIQVCETRTRSALNQTFSIGNAMRCFDLTMQCFPQMRSM